MLTERESLAGKEGGGGGGGEEDVGGNQTLPEELCCELSPPCRGKSIAINAFKIGLLYMHYEK